MGGDQRQPSQYELADTPPGFCAETVIPTAKPKRVRRISGAAMAITTRHMRHAYFMPFMRRLDPAT